jgi:hypothetical protein
MSSAGFGTCSWPHQHLASLPPDGDDRCTEPTESASPQVTGLQVSLANHLTSCFFPVEAERVTDGRRHCSFGLIVLFCRLSRGNVFEKGAGGEDITVRLRRPLSVNPALMGHRGRAEPLDVEAELHDVAVAHDVVLAFDAGFARGAGGGQ